MDERTKEALRIALSGAITGGVFGAGGKLLSGARGLGQIAKAGLVGSGIGASVAGGSNILGTELLGEPSPEEGSPASVRGLLGGALAGGLLGGGLGGLGAAGKLAVSRNSPAILRKLSEMASKNLPLDNLLVDQIRRWAGTGRAGVAKGAALGAGTLGAIGGMSGLDEGMSYDALQDQIEYEQRKKMMEQSNARY